MNHDRHDLADGVDNDMPFAAVHFRFFRAGGAGANGIDLREEGRASLPSQAGVARPHV